MAIIKEFTTPQGVDCNYHKLLKFEFNSVNNTLDLVLAVYKNAEARANTCTPVWHEYVSIPLEQLSSDPRDLFYPLLTQYTGSYIYGGVSDLTSNSIPSSNT